MNKTLSEKIVSSVGTGKDPTELASFAEGDVFATGPSQPFIPSPSGGSTVDTEVRTAIDLVLDVLAEFHITLPFEWPNEFNTGARSGELTILNLGTEGYFIDTADTIVENMHIVAGGLLITANNVTLRNCLIEFNGTYGVEFTTPVTGIVIEDCTIIGIGPEGHSHTCIIGAPAELTIERCNLSWAENGVFFSGGDLILRDTYIHDLEVSPLIEDPHYDGIQIAGCTSAIVEHNKVHGRDTSCIFLKSDFGAIDDVLIHNNYFADDEVGWPVNGTETVEFAVTNITLTDNYIEEGFFGYISFDGFTGPTVITGNVDAITEELLEEND